MFLGFICGSVIICSCVYFSLRKFKKDLELHIQKNLGDDTD